MELLKVIEIRWHGRGGQGAKTASLFFAEIMLATGKYIQAFPEYGPERMGAPMKSYNRLSENPITLHTNVINPDYVVVLDPTLIEVVNLTNGLNKTGKIIINTSFDSEYIAKKINFNKKHVYVIDASKIAIKNIGKNIPNTTMLGALIKVMNILDINEALNNIETKLNIKFRTKTHLISGNLDSIKQAFYEVKN
ncbi:MAG: 2-oxoacid:acceptor oxidoreductase family protein [Endomicrobium sp.]|jgi:pyruvate ferredoxin oxidoreductase gamma subunit|nr:2-oxoacid:acceptor oxidoreductase family protein [Endomicrobium sp.]